MCSGFEAGSYFRLIDCVYHSTLGLRVIKKKTKLCGTANPQPGTRYALNHKDFLNNFKAVFVLAVLYPQPSTLNPQPPTLNPKPRNLNPQFSTRNHKPSTLNSQLSTLNPQS